MIIFYLKQLYSIISATAKYILFQWISWMMYWSVIYIPFKPASVSSIYLLRLDGLHSFHSDIYEKKNITNNYFSVLNKNVNTNACHVVPTIISEKNLNVLTVQQFIHDMFSSYICYAVNQLIIWRYWHNAVHTLTLSTHCVYVTDADT